MKRINTMIRCLVAMPALAVALLTSCTSEEVVNSQPSGNPLELKAEMYCGYATRSASASNNVWTQGDIVAVADAGTPCQYKITDATSGTLSAVSTQIYWGTSQTSKALTAWSYGGGAYNAALPTSWGVSTDQSTADKLQVNDFLYASVTATPNTTTSLAFAHKLAKILIRVKCSNNTLTAANTTFSDVNVKVANTGTFSASSSSWSDPTGNTVAITPLTGTADGYLVTYTALVLPQTISNTELFQFTASVDGIVNTYVYTPVSQTLTAGSMQAFDINFDVDNVSVTSITASDWTTTTGGTITSKSTMIKKAAGTWTTDPDGTIKYKEGINVGDIYYADGTWSSTYDNSKTPIGVVVSTNPDYCEKAKGYGYGLVMALYDAGNVNWCSKTALGYPATNMKTLVTNMETYITNSSGLSNTNTITALSDYGSSNYPAFYNAKNYTPTGTSSSSGYLSSSSGWFLPSSGQFYEMMVNAQNYNKSGSGVSVTYTFPTTGNLNGISSPAGENISTEINYWFSSKGLNNFSPFSTSYRYFWTSSEYSSSTIPCVWFHPGGNLDFGTNTKDATMYVRPFLAF